MNQFMNNNWSIPQRPARAGLLIIFYKAIINIFKIVWPLLAVLLFNQRRKGWDALMIGLIVIPALVLLRSLIEYFYFRFQIVNDELIIRKGFISKKTITIPLSKIQAVHIEQALVHQLVQVVRVKIDTAGTDKTEASIDALSMEKAEQLRIFLLHEKQELTGGHEVQASPVEIPVIRLSISDIFKIGISANHIQTFILILSFAFSFINNLEEAFGERVVRTVRDSSSLVQRSISAVSLVITAVLALSVIVSMGRIALRYFDFNLSESPQGYKLSTGLINTRQHLVAFPRIQFISWSANWIRRKIGLYSLDFHQAMAGEHDHRKNQRIIVPVTKAGYIDELLRHYHAPVEGWADSVHYIQPAYPFRRALLVGILPVAFLLLLGWLFWWRLWLLWSLLWVPYVFINAVFFRKNFRLYLSAGALQVKEGVWGRESKIVKWYKLQHISLHQSIYQRHHSLATLVLYTAGGTITIPYITLGLAQMVRNYALYEIERSNRPWM